MNNNQPSFLESNQSINYLLYINLVSYVQKRQGIAKRDKRKI